MVTSNLAGGEASAKSCGSRNRDKIRPPRWKIVLAFFAIYFVWGSHFLAIKFAIETIPPFLMAGARFAIAGLVLYQWTARRAEPPSRAQWRSAAIVGALIFAGGNGALTWAEKLVDSGLAALLTSTIPLWMVLLTNWEHKARKQGSHLGGRLVLGLGLGLLGVGLLIGPGHLLGGGQVHPLGAAVLLGGALAFALGSIYSCKLNLPSSTTLAASMELLCGGVLLTLLGFIAHETTAFQFKTISSRSFLSVVYLILSGSLLTFPAYIWLLNHSTPARVSTYAYVNPIVAMILGCIIAGEALTLRTFTAAVLVLAAIVLIIVYSEPPPIPQISEVSVRPAGDS